MDRRRARPARLGLGLAALAAAAFAAPAEPPVRAMRWMASAADAARALATQPAECLTRPAGPDAALSVEVGRAAFRTPVVLGGQAARAGLSCESCHRGGRDNPDFQFPGISGAPGTADVTASLFSSHRGDGVFDPRPIPDLSGPKTRLKVGQAPADRSLEAFIHGLVTEEFDGPEPPKTVLAGLAAYVRALDPTACPAQLRQPLTSAIYLDDARRAARAGQALAGRGDVEGALVMVAAARARLGLIDERYAGARLAGDRAGLVQADTALAGIAEAFRRRDPAARAALSRWDADAAALGRRLARNEAASLFNPARLAAAARTPLPRKAP